MAVLREDVYPLYPLCYRSFLIYISTPPKELNEAEEAERQRQLSLF